MLTAAEDDDLVTLRAVGPMNRHAPGFAIGTADSDMHVSEELLAIIGCDIVLPISVKLRIGDPGAIAAKTDHIDEEATKSIAGLLAITQTPGGEDQSSEIFEHGISVPEDASFGLSHGLGGEHDQPIVVPLPDKKIHGGRDGEA